MSQFTVIFYEDIKGNRPVEEFLMKQNKKMRAKLLGLLEILQEKGHQLREPYSKHLEEGIFEIRGKVGTDITRVLYFFYYNGEIILTNGYVKKMQKTPRKEIEMAKARRDDFLRRREHENIK
ncbi:MAG: type II toxin-antitoxin system RelE/ParE family toxin [Lachnospiraceae bacterium]|nr:type II toxin-antitoxin system RelE/ParE family toxin [Lachnospiraceae bacterium]